MVTIWGLRLSIHLAIRNLGKGEDLRYVKMRERASSNWRFLSYIRVFMFQGFLQMLLMTPIVLVHYYPGQFGMSFLDYFGLLVWAIGFGIEAITDMQLTKFRSNATNSNKILKTGLWRYSRHPNYFGDALQWFAFFIISLNSGYIWGVIGPILMVFIFLKLTIGILERSQTIKRPGYEEYTKSTNVFFPGR
jgi:steroid 5-alpha reductase family enzyme